MLILTRKQGEKIAIGDNIFLNVIDIGKGYVKLGIDAPDHITILRQEVIDRIREENIEAASSRGDGLLKAVSILKQKNNNPKE